MNKDTRPIGVFDSGVGGLTAVKELHRIMPQENIIYFGDTGRVPYGTRSSETVKRYAKEAITYLAGFDVKAIVAACGTVSANFSQQDYKELGLSIPYFTVIEPAARQAVRNTKNKKIGVLATTASINSGAYTRALHALNPEIEVTGQACPLLVSLVEQGMTQRDNPLTNLALELYLEPLKEAGVDTVILGCTHFPVIADSIADQLGPEVSLVDSGAQTIQELKASVAPDSVPGEQTGDTRYYVTDTVEHFLGVAQHFLKEDISAHITYVDIESIDQNGKE